MRRNRAESSLRRPARDRARRRAGTRPERDRPIRDHGIAALWGAAEATCFFIVPDVWLSWLGTKSPKRAASASVSALAGALAGGVATCFWGARTETSESRAALRRLPAISGAMIDRADADIARDGNRAMLFGPLRGVPYKLFARSAGRQSTSLPGFLLWSVPARIPRFLAVAMLGTGGTRLAGRFLSPERTRAWRLPVFVALWTAFYAWYFRTVGREPGESGGR